jgi:hypothetical protein
MEGILSVASYVLSPSQTWAVEGGQNVTQGIGYGSGNVGNHQAPTRSWYKKRWIGNKKKGGSQASAIVAWKQPSASVAEGVIIDGRSRR